MAMSPAEPVHDTRPVRDTLAPRSQQRGPYSAIRGALVLGSGISDPWFVRLDEFTLWGLLVALVDLIDKSADPSRRRLLDFRDRRRMRAE
jgi:hypothetical protein